MKIHMWEFEHSTGCLWVQDVLDSGCSGWCGKSNRGFFHRSLGRDDSISVSRACQHPDPILAALLQRSNGYSKLAECKKNIATINPKASSMHKVFSFQESVGEGAFRCNEEPQRRQKIGNPCFAKILSKCCCTLLGRSSLQSNVGGFIHSPSLSFSPGFFYSTLTGIKISILFGVCLHWPSNYVWVKLGT